MSDIRVTTTEEVISIIETAEDTINVTVTEEVIEVGVAEGPIYFISSEFVTIKTAGQVLSANKVIVLNSVGKAIFADKDNLDHFFKVYGVTKESAVLDETVEITTYGEHENNTWSWELDKAIYLSAGGELTQSPPTTGFILEIGFPVTATKIFVNIKSSINNQ